MSSNGTKDTTGRPMIGSSDYFLGQALAMLAAAVAPSNPEVDGTVEKAARMAAARVMLGHALDAVAVEDYWVTPGTPGPGYRHEERLLGGTVLHGFSVSTDLLPSTTGRKLLRETFSRRIDDLLLEEGKVRTLKGTVDPAAFDDEQAGKHRHALTLRSRAGREERWACDCGLTVWNTAS